MNEIERIVGEVCAKNGIKKYSLKKLQGNEKGEGFLGEINFIRVTDEEKNEPLHLVVKKSFTDPTVRDLHPLRDAFLNEIYFYTEMWPKLNQMQDHLKSAEKFSSVPELLAFSKTDTEEMLVMNNFKEEGFEMFDKKRPLDYEHIVKNFKEYAKFHALSFAFKKKHAEEYRKFGTQIIDMYEKFLVQSKFGLLLEQVVELALRSLKPEDDPAVLKFLQNFHLNGEKIFRESLKCKGENTAVLHGDVWVSNEMFRYNEKRELVDIKLLDFQIARIGSPVHDLSYCFYSGASYALLADLDPLLKIYHESFAEHYAKIAGGAPPMSFADLKSDWLQYHKFGFIMAMVVWKMKATSKEDIVEVTDLTDPDRISDFVQTPYDVAYFDEKVRPLVMHMFRLETQVD